MSLFSKIVDYQHLRDSWIRVKKNHPASGVDEVSYEDFDGRIREELK